MKLNRHTEETDETKTDTQRKLMKLNKHTKETDETKQTHRGN